VKRRTEPNGGATETPLELFVAVTENVAFVEQAIKEITEVLDGLGEEKEVEEVVY